MTQPVTRAAARHRRAAQRRSRFVTRSAVAASVAALTLTLAVPAWAAPEAPTAVTDDASPFETSGTAAAEAESAVSTAQALSKKADGKIDTVDLDVQIGQLDQSGALPGFVVVAFTDLLQTTTTDVQAKLTAYEKKKAAEAKARAEALARANTPSGAKAVARDMMATKYGWGDSQFSCLASLWSKESGWNYKAYNAGSGATGIPQALPGSKMASAGSDWKTNAVTQIRWGLAYIERAYGTPCAAWGHSQATNWY